MSALGEFGHCIVVSCVVLGEDICGGSFFKFTNRPIRAVRIFEWAVRFICYILLYSLLYMPKCDTLLTSLIPL